MNKNWVAVTIGVAVALCLGGGVSMSAVTMFSGAPTNLAAGAAAAPTDCGAPANRQPAPTKVAGFNDEQVANATIIVQVGQEMKVPPRGWVIAVATAMQESGLRNLGHLGARNDHDSLGLFQQRPSTGWGTPEQIMDPKYASRKFYEALLKVSGWESMPLTKAAQRVQRSAFPNAYAKHETKAATLVRAISGGADQAGATPGECATPGEVNAGGWVQPVSGGVVSAFRTQQRPTHQGVDLKAGKRTPIKAAFGGTVIKAICDKGTLNTVGTCNKDGNSGAKGCGWYVDLKHSSGIITRYCHMIEKPMVTAGQTVAAGQQIGWSGSSGRSSGPHLHFEVHLNGDSSKNGATDPVKFMKENGAPLGSGG